MRELRIVLLCVVVGSLAACAVPGPTEIPPPDSTALLECKGGHIGSDGRCE